MSRELKESLEAYGVKVDEKPIKTPGAIEIVERYNATLLLANERIMAVIERKTCSQECLDFALFSNSCTVDHEELSLSLLFFGGTSWPSRMSYPPTDLQIARLIGQIIKEVEKRKTCRRNLLP